MVKRSALMVSSATSAGTDAKMCSNSAAHRRATFAPLLAGIHARVSHRASRGTWRYSSPPPLEHREGSL